MADSRNELGKIRRTQNLRTPIAIGEPQAGPREIGTSEELARAEAAQARLPHGLVRIPITGGVVEYCRCCGQRTEILDQPEIEDSEPEESEEVDQYFYDNGGPSRSAWLCLGILAAIVLLLLTVAWWPIPS